MAQFGNTYGKSVTDLLFQREYGTESLPLKYEIAKLRTQQLTYSSYVPSQDVVGKECGFLEVSNTGYPIGVFYEDVAFRYSVRRYSAIHQFTIQYSSPCGGGRNKPYPLVRKIKWRESPLEHMEVTDVKVVDLKNQTICLFCGNSVKYSGIVATVILDKSTDKESSYEWRCKKNVWCCCYNSFLNRFAVGCDGGYHCFGISHFGNLRKMTCNVTSMGFNNNGNILYCGTDKCGVAAHDLRENLHQNSTVVSSENAKEMQLLSDDVSLVVSGTNGKLLKIDTRMKKTVFQYSEHIESSKRKPFSLCEDLDLICAVGNDNLIRIWSLSTGKLLRLFDEIPNHNPHCCLVSEQRRWFIFLIQDFEFGLISYDEINTLVE